MAPFPAISIFSRNVLDRLRASCPNKSPPPLPKNIWQSPLYFIAFGLGAGAMPFAPGTFGTLLAIPFYGLLQSLPLASYIAFVLLFIVFSAWISEKVSREIHVHDHPGMCIDEFAGYFVTMVHAPLGLSWMLVGFLLFRFFDIYKPGPIRYVDRALTGGWGMVLDDVLAGLFAFAIMQVLRFVVG
jgi:phosphatidylglycerophosphatase A